MYTEKDNAYWKEFAALVGAEFIPREYWHSPKVKKSYKGLTIVFDSFFHSTVSGMYSSEKFFTRAYTSFPSKTNFNFRIKEKSLSDHIYNLFNWNYFKTEDERFNKKYAFKSSDEYILAKILNSKETRELIDSLEKTHLQLRYAEDILDDPSSREMLELTYHREGRTISHEQLFIVHKLFEKIIDDLHNTNIINAAKS